MFSFRSLGSGSSGNAYLLGTDEGYFLIDAGVGIRALNKYLFEMGLTAGKLAAIFLTHDHCDHAKNAGNLQRAAAKMGHELTVYTTPPTVRGIDGNPTIRYKLIPEQTQFLEKEAALICCGCSITPFNVPHDSEDNNGYFLEYGDLRFCLLTDAGAVTPAIERYVSQADYLVLESNYDLRMLQTGPYPLYLRTRIHGNNGHLSNSEAANLIFEHRHHLKQVWLCHLSENNNLPRVALETVENRFSGEGMRLDDFVKVEVLGRKIPSPLYRW